MKNKVVLITGALTGIGRATALAFAQEGARTSRTSALFFAQSQFFTRLARLVPA